MDGSVVIGTELDTKQLDKQLKDSEKELAKYEKEAEELLKQRSELDIDTKQAQMELDAVDKKIKEIKSEMSRMEMTPGKTEGASYKIAGINLSKEEQKRKEILSEIETKYESIDKKIRDNANSQQRIRQEIQQTSEALNMSEKVDNIANAMGSVGKSIRDTVRNTIRWGLAIFGIRSAYMFLSQAMSTLSQYDEQLGVNIQYIRYLLASTLKPVIEYLVQLAYKLLAYINFIAKALFGVNLFANASTEAFQKQNKALGGSVNKAKELKKTLTGFDEMNILQDNGDVGSGGGGGGVGNIDLPNFPAMEDIPIPKWLQWLVEHGEILRTIILGIASAILALKLGLTGLQGLGIFLILDGVYKFLKDIKKLIEDPSWDNFADVLRDIGEIILGFSLVIGITSPVGLVLAIIGQAAMIIAGIIKQIKNLIEFIKDPSWDNFFELIKGFPGTLGIIGLAIDWLIENVLGGWDKIKELLENLGSWAEENIIKPIIGCWDIIKGYFSDVVSWISDNIIEPVKTKFQELWDKIVEIFSPVITFFSDIFSTVVENIGIMKDNIIIIASFIWNKIKEIFGVVSQWVTEHIINPIKEKYNEIKSWFEDKIKNIKAKVMEIKDYMVSKFTEAREKIKQVFSPLIDFFSILWNKIKAKFTEIGKKIGEVVGGAFKSAINFALSSVDRIINTPIKGINLLIDKIRDIPGLGSLKKLNTITIPRLAKGGIINMPGRGVPVGGAIAGERGAEGVIPLTDSQQMALLGEAIGKYITINANITNTMNGRVISRELQKVQNESDFAYNR